MNLGRRMVHQPYHGSFEIIHDPNHQVHHNPRVLDHILLVIHCTKASQSNYYIITTGKLNADWSNKQYLQYNKSCNKAMIRYSMFAPFTEFGFGGRIWRVYVLDAERILSSIGNLNHGLTQGYEDLRLDLPEAKTYNYGLAVDIVVIFDCSLAPPYKPLLQLQVLD